MKKLLLIAILIFYSSASFARMAWVDNKEMCEKTRGVWRMFANDCADICDSKFDHTICTSNPAYNCECGENRCWDGNKCTSNKVAKLAWEEKTKPQREQRISELKELEIKIAQFKANILTNNTTANIDTTGNVATTNTSGVQPAPNTTNNTTTQPTTNPPVTTGLPFSTPTADHATEQRDKEQKDTCEKQNGAWQQFANGCVDSCSSKITKMSMCTMALTFGCKCGENKCWDGTTSSCIETEKYKQLMSQSQNINNNMRSSSPSPILPSPGQENKNTTANNSTLPPLPPMPNFR